MPINVADAKANYVASASLAGQKYKKKVAANQTWSPNASSAASEQLWAAAVAAAAAAQRRMKAVAQVSQSSWVAAASGPGAANLPAGMTNHQDKWATNFGPYAPVLDQAQATMPARGIGAAANIARVLYIDQALENQKKAIKG